MPSKNLINKELKFTPTFGTNWMCLSIRDITIFMIRPMLMINRYETNILALVTISKHPSFASTLSYE